MAIKGILDESYYSVINSIDFDVTAFGYNKDNFFSLSEISSMFDENDNLKGTIEILVYKDEKKEDIITTIHKTFGYTSDLNINNSVFGNPGENILKSAYLLLTETLKPIYPTIREA